MASSAKEQKVQDSKGNREFQICLGSLVVRASDSRPEGLGSMPDATKFPPSTHGVRARSIPKLWRWRSLLSPSIVPSGNFADLIRTVTCMVLKANDRRTSSPLPR
ncbi:hypothetical protein TNCV_2598571 [Trichonephila clavipes]|nr:hypothetical protein TNCV_2598571 [Trichonephila clavipes]